ncbi:MAG: hypothetical protein IM659_04890 [Phenylobacterium sp.]|nr:hypothetical protein [Phenylobacterium sp.]
MNAFMLHAVDPAGQALWRGAGTELTPAGEQDLCPTDEESREDLVNAASTVAGTGSGVEPLGAG